MIIDDHAWRDQKKRVPYSVIWKLNEDMTRRDDVAIGTSGFCLRTDI